MLFGVNIDTLYVIVIGSVLACLALTGVAWLVNEIREWRKRDGPTADKSGR